MGGRVLIYCRRCLFHGFIPPPCRASRDGRGKGVSERADALSWPGEREGPPGRASLQAEAGRGRSACQIRRLITKRLTRGLTPFELIRAQLIDEEFMLGVSLENRDINSPVHAEIC